MKHLLGRFLAAVMVITLLLGMLPVGSFAAEVEAPRYISLADCPSFTLRGPEGVYPLEQYSNNGILLVFGRVTCGNTQALLAQLNGRVDTLAERGIQVFANLEYTFRLEDFSTLPSVYPNITYTYGDDLLWSRLLDLVDPHLEGFIFPLVFVIDRNGSIIYYSTGYVSDMGPLLTKVDAAATDQPLPEPQPADDSYYGSLYKYTGDKDALQTYIRQQLAQKNPYISAFDVAYTGNWEDWVGEELAYAMFDILEADAEAYGPYTIPDTWVYYSDARQVLITLDYPYVPTQPTEPVETEPAPDVTGGTCGENLTWTLDGEGILTVSGSGAMDNYDSLSDVPWYDSRASVKSVVIEEGVTSIGKSAFYKCSNLVGVTIPEGITVIGDRAFEDCSSLTNITIPDSVTGIGDWAFENCSSLTDITIPEGVTGIGNYAFYYCLNLTSITLPEGITSIGNYVFANCASLTDITIPDSVTSIGDSAFFACTSLSSITIPDSVTSIGNSFDSCINLSSITIPESVTSIDRYAFSDCLSLTTVHYAGTEAQKADVLSDFANWYLTGATWHYECNGVDCLEPETPPVEEDKPMENPFVDVAEGAYYFDPVLWAVNEGITNGMTETTFAPDGTCTRAQIVTFLWRANGSPKVGSTNPFTDVPADAWYTDAVLWAVEQGITTGTSATTFSPDAGCTRGQVATFLWRAEGEPASGAENIFTDITPDAYYYDAVLWAVANEITKGMGDGAFAPDATCTRGQIVTFLYRAMA